MRGLGAALAVGLVALAGCDQLRATITPDTPTWKYHPSGALGVRWRKDVTAPSRKADPAYYYERTRPEIDPAHRRVFVGSSDKRLYALRAEDGSHIWSFDTLGAVQGEPLYDPEEDVVYFGSNDGALYKVRASDGALVFRFMTSAEVSRKPVIRGDTVYVVNANDTLAALDRKTGKMKWYQSHTPAYGMEIAGYAGPAQGSRFIYTAFSDGTVMAYDPKNGAELWPTVDLASDAEQSLGETPRYLDVDTTPQVGKVNGEELVFVASYAGGVVALDALDGTRTWENTAPRGVTEILLWEQPEHAARGADGRPTKQIIPERKILFATSGATGLWALDPTDGRTLWRRDVPAGGMSAPVPYQGALLVGTTRYGAFLVDVLKGDVIDAIETGGSVAGTPAAYGRYAFYMTNGGSMVSLDLLPPEPARLAARVR